MATYDVQVNMALKVSTIESFRWGLKILSNHIKHIGDSKTCS